MKQKFCALLLLRWWFSAGKLRVLKVEPTCINHAMRTFVKDHSTLSTSCSLKPAVPEYVFPDFDTLGLALLRNSGQDARYRQIFYHWKFGSLLNFSIVRSLGSIWKHGYSLLNRIYELSTLLNRKNKINSYFCNFETNFSKTIGIDRFHVARDAVCFPHKV